MVCVSVCMITSYSIKYMSTVWHLYRTNNLKSTLTRDTLNLVSMSKHSMHDFKVNFLTVTEKMRVRAMAASISLSFYFHPTMSNAFANSAKKSKRKKRGETAFDRCKRRRNKKKSFRTTPWSLMVKCLECYHFVGWFPKHMRDWLQGLKLESGQEISCLSRYKSNGYFPFL